MNIKINFFLFGQPLGDKFKTYNPPIIKTNNCTSNQSIFNEKGELFFHDENSATIKSFTQSSINNILIREIIYYPLSYSVKNFISFKPYIFINNQRYDAHFIVNNYLQTSSQLNINKLTIDFNKTNIQDESINYIIEINQAYNINSTSTTLHMEQDKNKIFSNLLYKVNLSTAKDKNKEINFIGDINCFSQYNSAQISNNKPSEFNNKLNDLMKIFKQNLDILSV
jgi:hypothetical protein